MRVQCEIGEGEVCDWCGWGVIGEVECVIGEGEVRLVRVGCNW